MLRITSTFLKQVRYVKRMPTRRGDMKVTPNPGVENRLEIFKMDTPSFENVEEYEMDVDELESDFSSAGEMHREFEREKIKAGKTLSFVVTKDRFFKSPKLPNLLTWSEKEQIKHLHQLDPKEWDAESLSNSFPATPDVIKKILKSKWKLKDSSALERHDKAVERNWILLKEGKFTLEEGLRCHFLKFSSRKSVNLFSEINESKPIIVHNRPQKSEFVSLLSERVRKSDENSLEKSIEVDIPELLVRNVDPDQKSDSFMLPGKKREKTQLMSFTEFKEKFVESETIVTEMSGLSNSSSENQQSCENIVAESASSYDNVPERSKAKATKELVKYKESSVEENLTSKQLDMFLKADNYARKIKVPGGKKDPLAVYKVDDCFYDYDGSFLFRVPGIK